MEAGEIKIVLSGSIPSLRVCDGTKTAGKLFDGSFTYPDANQPGFNHSPVDGEIMVGPYYNVYPSLIDWNLFIGYSGKWWFTTAVWHIDNTVTGSPLPGEIGVLRWSEGDVQTTPTPDLPVIVVIDTSNRMWWCAVDWVQL